MNLLEALAEAQQGIDLVEANNKPWVDQAYELLERYVATHHEIHVDALWEFFEANNLGAPENGKAMGAVMQRGGRTGLMRKTDRVRPSVRSHGAGKPIWLSLKAAA